MHVPRRASAGRVWESPILRAPVAILNFSVCNSRRSMTLTLPFVCDLSRIGSASDTPGGPAAWAFLRRSILVRNHWLYSHIGRRISRILCSALFGAQSQFIGRNMWSRYSSIVEAIIVPDMRGSADDVGSASEWPGDLPICLLRIVILQQLLDDVDTLSIRLHAVRLKHRSASIARTHKIRLWWSGGTYLR